MARVSRISLKKHHVRWIFSHVVISLFCAAAAVAIVAAAQTLTTETLVSTWERDVLGWLLLHRGSREADPRLAVVAVDTPTFETQQSPEERPDTPPGKPLKSYKPK